MYIYELSAGNWYETRFQVTNGLIGQGISMTGDGSLIVVASDAYAHIYSRVGATWDETRIALSGDAGSFRSDVAVSDDGNTIVVGRYGTGYRQTGAIYVYEWDGSIWNETEITASDGNIIDRFGWSVDISGDGNTIIVGAHTAGYSTGSWPGAAYVYKRFNAGWSETKITASDGTSGDSFGHSVAISYDGFTAIVGAYEDQSPASGASFGSAYIYKWNGATWAEDKISSPYNDPELPGPYDQLGTFGQSVAVTRDGRSVVINSTNSIPEIAFVMRL